MRKRKRSKKKRQISKGNFRFCLVWVGGLEMHVSQHNFFWQWSGRNWIQSTMSVTVRNSCCIVAVDGSGVICGLFWVEPNPGFTGLITPSGLFYQQAAGVQLNVNSPVRRATNSPVKTRSLLLCETLAHGNDRPRVIEFLFFTVRKRSCGKVMFSQACVKNSVGRGGEGAHPR